MPIRFPAPLLSGARIGVTAPSAGVPAALQPRLDFCLQRLRDRGFDVVVGECLLSDGITSAPAAERAAELMAMMADPSIAAVVPPWGGELAIELIRHLDFDLIAAAEPTWLLGFSDTSTLLLPLTLLTGVASAHGQNLMDTPYEVPAPLLSWLDVLNQPTGAEVVQGASTMHGSGSVDDWVTNPTATRFHLDTAGGWRILDPMATDLRLTGRLIGGCIETIAPLAGTAFGDLRRFAAQHAPEGLVVYLEASEDGPADIARGLWAMRLAGWFDHATAILVGRTHAPDAPNFTQTDAVRSALGDLGIPVVLDVDCGHVPPHATLINGALATVTISEDGAWLSQLIG